MRWSVWVIALAAGLAAAAPPVVPGALDVEVKEPVTFSVKGTTGKQIGSAATFDDKSLMLVRLWSSDPAVIEYLLFPKKAGTYHLVFWTEGEVTGSVLKVVVKGDGGPPPPPPSGVFTIVYLEETSVAVGTRGALLSNEALDARLKAKGHSLRIVDKDVIGSDGKTPADLVDLIEKAKGKSYPQLFLVDKKSKQVVSQCDGPTKAVDLLKVLDANGG